MSGRWEHGGHGRTYCFEVINDYKLLKHRKKRKHKLIVLAGLTRIIQNKCGARATPTNLRPNQKVKQWCATNTTRRTERTPSSQSSFFAEDAQKQLQITRKKKRKLLYSGDKGWNINGLYTNNTCRALQHQQQQKSLNSMPQGLVCANITQLSRIGMGGRVRVRSLIHHANPLTYTAFTTLACARVSKTTVTRQGYKRYTASTTKNHNVGAVGIPTSIYRFQRAK